MDWRKTYPPLATVMEAGLQTICTWCDNLPSPTTDVERTVLRRLEVRRQELGDLELRRQVPELADKINEIIDLMERHGIASPVQKI